MNIEREREKRKAQISFVLIANNHRQCRRCPGCFPKCFAQTNGKKRVGVCVGEARGGTIFTQFRFMIRMKY